MLHVEDKESKTRNLSNVNCLLRYFKLRKTLGDTLNFLLRFMKDFMAHVTKTDFARRDLSLALKVSLNRPSFILLLFSLLHLFHIPTFCSSFRLMLE